jgi:hypothetical protein
MRIARDALSEDLQKEELHTVWQSVYHSVRKRRRTADAKVNFEPQENR